MENLVVNLLELIAGSSLHPQAILCTVLSSSIFFGVQGAMERNCIRRHELKCFCIFKGHFPGAGD